jgi:hypothetical protein
MKTQISCLFLLFSLFLRAQLPPYVSSNGLEGYWPFSGNANDLSGNGRNGSVNGATLTYDRFSNTSCAYNFSGSADIKTQYPGILGTNARSVSFWARTNHSVTIMCGVAWGAIGTAARYEAGFNYGAPGPMLDGGNGVITYSPTVPAYDNQWHHYVMQFGSSSMLSQVEVYQDAVLLTTTSNVLSGGNILNTISNFDVRFGSIPGSPDHYFRGDLDDIGIWNRPLSELEILALFKSSNCPNPGNKSSVPCVSVSEEQMPDLHIFPNPVSNRLQITGLNSNASLSVMDISGRVLSLMVVGNGEVDFSNLPSGIYFLRLADPSVTVFRKVVKE